MAYGQGHLQKRIRQLGKSGNLRWRHLVALYGISRAKYELEKLVSLGLIERPILQKSQYNPNSTLHDPKELQEYYDTKILWIEKR